MTLLCRNHSKSIINENTIFHFTCETKICYLPDKTEKKMQIKLKFKKSKLFANKLQ